MFWSVKRRKESVTGRAEGRIEDTFVIIKQAFLLKILLKTHYVYEDYSIVANRNLLNYMYFNDYQHVLF